MFVRNKKFSKTEEKIKQCLKSRTPKGARTTDWKLESAIYDCNYKKNKNYQQR